MILDGTVISWGAMKSSVLDMIHVDDLANAMVMAAGNDEVVGKDIIVSDNSEGVTFPELVALVGEQMQCSYRSIHLPYWVMMGMAKVTGFLKKLGVMRNVPIGTAEVRGFGLMFPFKPVAAKAMGWRRNINTREAFSACVKQAKL